MIVGNVSVNMEATETTVYSYSIDKEASNEAIAPETSFPPAYAGELILLHSLLRPTGQA